MLPFDFDTRESAITEFFDDLKLIEKQFLKDLESLITGKGKIESETLRAYRSASPGQLSAILGQLDFFTVLDDYPLEEATEKYLTKYSDVIKEMRAYAERRGLNVSGVSIDQLDTLIDLETDSILKRASAYSADLKKEMVRNFIAGTDRNEIANRLYTEISKTVPFTPHWARVATSQAFTAFRATTIDKVMSTDTDKPVRYNLLHPQDDNNRHACKVAIAISKKNPKGFTRAEIDAGALGVQYTFENLGGFNCRGDWMPTLESVKEAL